MTIGLLIAPVNVPAPGHTLGHADGQQPPRNPGIPLCYKGFCGTRTPTSGDTGRRRHRRRFSLGTLERCIVWHESGDDRWASNGNDYGWYQFLPATYNEAARMAGVRERKIPWEGSLKEETLAFRALWRVDPEAWETAPDCT